MWFVRKGLSISIPAFSLILLNVFLFNKIFKIEIEVEAGKEGSNSQWVSPCATDLITLNKASSPTHTLPTLLPTLLKWYYWHFSKDILNTSNSPPSCFAGYQLLDFQSTKFAQVSSSEGIERKSFQIWMRIGKRSFCGRRLDLEWGLQTASATAKKDLKENCSEKSHSMLAGFNIVKC